MATTEQGHLPNRMYIDRDGQLHVNGSSIYLDESGSVQTAAAVVAGASGTAGTVTVFPSTASKGKAQISCTDQTGDTTCSIVVGAMASARTLTITDPVASSAGIHPQGIQAMTADGAITIKSGLVTLSKAGVLAATLADPTTTTDDGKVLRVVSLTANAHTISNAAGSGFNGAGTAKDVATLGGAIGDGLTVIAYQGKWYVVGSVNATLA